MIKSHKILLDVLSRKPMSKKELSEETGYSEDGIRGRLSEMRKLGYDIVLEEVTDRKYVLKYGPKEKVLKFLKENDMFSIKFDVKKVGNEIGLSHDDVAIGVAKVFVDKRYSVLQLAKDEVVVFEKGLGD